LVRPTEEVPRNENRLTITDPAKTLVKKKARKALISPAADAQSENRSKPDSDESAGEHRDKPAAGDGWIYPSGPPIASIPAEDSAGTELGTSQSTITQAYRTQLERVGDVIKGLGFPSDVKARAFLTSPSTINCPIDDGDVKKYRDLIGPSQEAFAAKATAPPQGTGPTAIQDVIGHTLHADVMMLQGSKVKANYLV
jgi:hypothetical protein